jgi:hypothetical protein
MRESGLKVGDIAVLRLLSSHHSLPIEARVFAVKKERTFQPCDV